MKMTDRMPNNSGNKINQRLNDVLTQLMREGEFIGPNESLNHVVSVAVFPSSETTEGTLTMWNANVTNDQKVSAIIHLCFKLIESGVPRNWLLTELVLRLQSTDQTDQSK
jgi:hypothetical protein